MNKKFAPVFFLLVVLLLRVGQLRMIRQKNSTGKAGELVIVINPDIWQSAAGRFLDTALTQPQIGLPQPEPIFDVINIPHQAFADILKQPENLIVTKINPSITDPGVQFNRDVYASTQGVVNINAKDYQQFQELSENNIDKIIGFFLKMERERIIYNYSNYNNKAISEKTEKHFGITLSIPPGYNVAEASDSFMWIRYETPDQSGDFSVFISIHIRQYIYLKFLLSRRNINLKKYVPGPTTGSYMSTDRVYPLLFNTMKNKGNYAAELRGLWKLENDFMGGPFVNVATLDLLKKRVVVLDGYVYAPNKDKRNYLRQVEGIIYSAKFTNQSEMDKLNKQFEE